jgi:hypothetical protein
MENIITIKEILSYIRFMVPLLPATGIPKIAGNMKVKSNNADVPEVTILKVLEIDFLDLRMRYRFAITRNSGIVQAGNTNPASWYSSGPNIIGAP